MAGRKGSETAIKTAENGAFYFFKNTQQTELFKPQTPTIIRWTNKIWRTYHPLSVTIISLHCKSYIADLQ